MATAVDGHRVRRCLALLAGLAVASAGFLVIAAVQPEGLDPPPETAAIFLVAASASAIAYHLLATGDPLGYPAAVLTGLFVLVGVAVVVAGVYGPAGPRTNPLGPIAYVVLAVAVMALGARGWRRVG